MTQSAKELIEGINKEEKLLEKLQDISQRAKIAELSYQLEVSKSTEYRDFKNCTIKHKETVCAILDEVIQVTSELEKLEVQNDNKDNETN